MIASRYGTVAIVRETGGLRDSITPYGAGGNGFTFRDYNAYDMLYVINEAIGVYHNKDEWKRLDAQGDDDGLHLGEVCKVL